MEKLNFLTYKLPISSVKNLSVFLLKNAKEKSHIVLHFSDAHSFVEAEKNPHLRKIFQSDIVICDGFPLSKYLKFKNSQFRQIRGIDFMRETIIQSPSSISHFFLGSTAATLKKITDNALIINPSLSIARSYSPDFGGNWSSELVSWEKMIQQSGADIVWIGMGAPKQFHIANALSVNNNFCVVSIGAAFDFLAGTKKEAPKIIRLFGLEWFFRFASEPRRLLRRYFPGNLQFCRLLVKDFFSKH